MLRDALARFLNRVVIPNSFRELAEQGHLATVVMRGRSLAYEGLLLSFVKRSGFDGILDCSKQYVKPSERDPSKIYFLSLDAEASIRRLAEDDLSHPFITMDVIAGRGPMRSTVRYKVSYDHALATIFIPKKLIIMFGAPIVLSQHKERFSLWRRLKVDFYRNLKLVRGTPFQPRHVQARTVLAGTEFENDCRIIAQRTKVPIERVKKRALKDFYEISANPIRSVYLALAVALRLVMYSLFTDVKLVGLERFVKEAGDDPVVLVPMHRSHIDYLVLGWSLYRSNLNTPLTAAGINLSFWPIGFIIQSAGAYFVRRNNRDPVHSLVLKRYVTYLIKRGHLQEFFIEGGRSRSGKMQPPKMGLLKVLVEAYFKGVRKDILFVPVSITYENVIEDVTFGDENTGQKKRKESLIGLLRARSVLRRKYGEVIVNIGSPISIAKYEKSTAKSAQNGRRRNVKTVVNDLALELTDQIRLQSNTSLTSLALLAIMSSPHYSLTEEQLKETIRELCQIIIEQRKVHKQIGSFTSSLERFHSGQDELLSDIVRTGIVQKEPFGDSNSYLIRGNKRFTADFYKNSVIHLFVSPAIMALCELIEGEITIEGCKNLHRLFKSDFLLPEESRYVAELSALIEVFKSAGILKERRAKMVFKKRTLGNFNPGLLLSSLQGQILAHYGIRFSPRSTDDAGDLEYEKLMQYVQTSYITTSRMGLVTRTEASSRTTLGSAIDSLASRKVILMQSDLDQSKRIAATPESSNDYNRLLAINDAILAFQMEQSIELRDSAFRSTAQNAVSEEP